MLVYTFIVGYKQHHDGNSPTYRTIMDGLDYKSVYSIQYYVEMLEKAGMLQKIDGHLCIGGKWTPPREMRV